MKLMHLLADLIFVLIAFAIVAAPVLVLSLLTK